MKNHEIKINKKYENIYTGNIIIIDYYNKEDNIVYYLDYTDLNVNGNPRKLSIDLTHNELFFEGLKEFEDNEKINNYTLIVFDENDYSEGNIHLLAKSDEDLFRLVENSFRKLYRSVFIMKAGLQIGYWNDENDFIVDCRYIDYDIKMPHGIHMYEYISCNISMDIREYKQYAKHKYLIKVIDYNLKSQNVYYKKLDKNHNEIGETLQMNAYHFSKQCKRLNEGETSNE